MQKGSWRLHGIVCVYLAITIGVYENFLSFNCVENYLYQYLYPLINLLDKVIMCLSLCLEALHNEGVHVSGSNAPPVILVINDEE